MGIIASIYNDTGITFNAGETAVRNSTLSNTPGGFVGSAVADVQIATTSRYNLLQLNNDTISVGIRITSGATVLAAATSGGGYVTILGPWTGSSYNITNQFIPGTPISFPYVNTGASKTVWDAAIVELSQSVTVSMGADGCYTYFSATAGYRLDFDIITTARDVNCTTEALLNTKVAATITKLYIRNVNCTTETLTLIEGQGVIGPQVIGAPEALLLSSAGSAVVVGDAKYPITFLDTGGIQLFTEVLSTSGTHASVLKSRVVSCATEALSQVGTHATVLHNHKATGTPEALSLTENPASIGRTRTVNATSEALANVGSAAIIFRGINRHLTCTTEALSQVGTPAQIGRATNREVTGTTEVLTTSATGAVDKGRSAACTAESLSQHGNTATVRTSRKVTGATESLLNTKVAATVSKVLVKYINCTTEALKIYSLPGNGTRPHLLRKASFLWTCTGPDYQFASTFIKSVATTFKPPSYSDWNDAFVNIFGGGSHGTSTLTGNYWTDDVTTLSVVGDVSYDVFRPVSTNYSSLRFNGGYVTKGPSNNLDPDNYWLQVGYIRPDSVAGTQVIWSDRYTNTGSGVNGQEFRLDAGGDLNLYAWDVAQAVFLDTSTESPAFTLSAGKWYWYYVGLDNAETTYYIYACEAGGVPQLVKSKARGAGLIGTVGTDYYPLHWGYGIDDAPNPFIGNMVDMAASSVRWADTNPDPAPEVPMRYTQINGWDTANNPYLRSLTSMTLLSGGQIVPDLGGMSHNVTAAAPEGPSTRGIAASAFDYLHKLTTSYTVECAYHPTDSSQVYNLFTTTGSSSLAAGVRCTRALDGTVTFEVRRFNTTPAISLSSAAGAMPYNTGTRVAVSYNKTLDYFSLRINGTVVASGPTTNAPDTATSANTTFYVGPYTGQTSEYEGQVRNILLVQYDRYGVAANYADYTDIPQHFQVVTKDRIVVTTPAANVCTGNPATIDIQVGRTVGGVTEVLTQVGNQATIDKLTEFPRDVVCTTGAMLLTESTATVGKGQTANGTTEIITTVGSQATIVTDRLVTCTPEAVLSYGSTAQIFKGVDRDVSGMTEALSASAAPASIVRDRLVTCTPAANLLSANPASAVTDRPVACQPEVLSTSATGAVRTDRAIVTVVEHLTVYSNPAYIDKGRNARGITAPLVLVESPATADQGRNLQYFPEALLTSTSPATIGKGVRGVVDCVTAQLVQAAPTAYVRRMTIVGPLPRYDKLGYEVVCPASANPLLPPIKGGNVRSGTGAETLPAQTVQIVRG